MSIYSPSRNPSGFYIYAYLRDKDSITAKYGTPYYIGKGSGNRAFFKEQRQVKAPKNKDFIVILESNLTETGALALERRYIKWYGRKDLGTGILANMTDGGDGVSNPSEETRKKIALGQLGRKQSDETRLKRSVSHFGKKRPDQSEKMKGANNPMFGVKRSWNKGAAGKKWYNNGTQSVMSIECPIGFVLGRLAWKK